MNINPDTIIVFFGCLIMAYSFYLANSRMNDSMRFAKVLTFWLMIVCLLMAMAILGTEFRHIIQFYRG